MMCVTNKVRHTDKHTLKEILSAWLLLYGMNPVPLHRVESDNYFYSDSAPYMFNWDTACAEGLIVFSSDTSYSAITMQLTSKALEYINDDKISG